MIWSAIAIFGGVAGGTAIISEARFPSRNDSRISINADIPAWRWLLGQQDRPSAQERLYIHPVWGHLIDDCLVNAVSGFSAWVRHLRKIDRASSFPVLPDLV